MIRVALALLVPVSIVCLVLGDDEATGDKQQASAEQQFLFHVAVREHDKALPPLRSAIERLSADHGSLRRSDAVPMSAEWVKRQEAFYRTWLATMAEVDFDALDQAGKVDYVLAKNHLERESRAPRAPGKLR